MKVVIEVAGGDEAALDFKRELGALATTPFVRAGATVAFFAEFAEFGLEVRDRIHFHAARAGVEVVTIALA